MKYQIEFRFDIASTCVDGFESAREAQNYIAMNQERLLGDEGKAIIYDEEMNCIEEYYHDEIIAIIEG